MTGNQKQLVGFPFLSCQEHFLFITVHLKKGEEGTLVEFKKTESHTDSCQVSCPSVTLMCPFIWLSPNCLHREHLLGTKKSVSFPTKLPVYWEATLPRSLQKNYSTICNRGFISFHSVVESWRGEVKVAQSCQTLCDPMGYTVLGIVQARILEWVTFPFSRGSSQPRDQTQVSHTAGRFFPSWATREAHQNYPLITNFLLLWSFSFFVSLASHVSLYGQ